ncbi:hypothetical protein WN944_026187 [Citrus x changshan-huyou]|uniref:TF-B3 domain-containing protein n=1 Tax=Citrus x changshan-huyou TaxID=2935761 RepID=A0AAP0LR63_9ROSI
MSSKEKSNNNYPEELKELGAAALALTCIKNTRLDNKAKATLHKLKTTYPGNSVREAASVIAQNSSANSALDDEYKPPDIPPLVQNLRGVIGRCSKPMQKNLTNTDLNASQCRLLMNRASVLEFLVPLLNEGECQTLKAGIQVTTYDLDGNAYTMSFKVWADKYYVLTSGWTKFHQDNGLTDKHGLTLWMFRHVETQKLCFVISWRKVA